MLISEPSVRPAPAHPVRAPRRGPAEGFRPDVEGLRAVAVGLVLLYHAGLPFVPAGFVGVDVFFVISGFLITGLLVKEMRQTGRISLAGFYARRAKRLLPAAALVLATTVLMTVAFLPRTRWSDVGGDIVSAALYVVNWRLAGRSVDYLAEDAVASPVQHYWSLAVEEQYYLLWPVLLLIASWWARRGGRSTGTSLWIGVGTLLGCVALSSLAWSVYLTGHEAASAFFVTTTRMWELAIGAAVALAAAALVRLPRRLAAVLGWAGLAAIAASALVYSTNTPWPSSAALLPTLGAAAVIAAGAAAGPAGPAALLGTGPFRWVGGLSYSLYLWHWPLLVFAAAYLGGLGPGRGLAVAAVSVIPAWLTHKLVENPIRFSRRISRQPRLALTLGAGLTLVGVVGGLVPVVALARATDDIGIHPNPLAATKDVPDAYARGCQAPESTAEPVTCLYGDPDGQVTVAVVGDSKILQWISALDTIGERRGWRVQTYTKSACSFTAATISLDGAPYDTCTRWNAAVLDRLRADPPDAVVTSQGRRTALDGGSEAMAAGLRDRWSQLARSGVWVAVVLDNPHPPDEVSPVYECVSQHPDAPRACAFARDEAARSGASSPQLAAAKGLRGVQVIDLTDDICPGDRCPPVIGNVLVYRQGSHLTRTYVDTLAPRLEKALVPIVEGTPP